MNDPLLQSLLGRRPVAASPVGQRAFPTPNEMRLPPGTTTAQMPSATHRFSEVDTVDPLARLLSRGRGGMTVDDTRRMWGQAETAAGFTGGIRAYHGSPHDFTRFRMDRIGTGEGAQRYGHGLYFAEMEDVARGYRDTLGGRTARVGGYDVASLNPPAAVREYIPYLGTPNSPANMREWRDIMETSLRDQEHMARSMRGRAFIEERAEAERLAQASREGIAWLRAHEDLPLSFRPNGRMYEVNLNADPNRMLDWDIPLRSHGAEAQRSLMALPNAHRFQPEWTGANLYESTALVPGTSRDAAAATQALRDAGIPGIRYLDGGSRAAGGGTSNYVMFDDNLIEILRKYGIGGLGIGLGAATTGTGQQ